MFAQEAGAALLLSDAHVMAAVRRHRHTHNLGKTRRGRRHLQARAVLHCRAGRAIDNSDGRSARTRDSVVGELLSLLLLPILGVCLVLFGKQLRDGWLWRCDPPIEVADVGATREHDGRADVRNIREFFCLRSPRDSSALKGSV
jgi:hypothetical protein